MKIITFDEISSTNDYLKDHFNKYNSFTIVKTNYQNKGRGQFDRVWNSEKNKNILFSILLKDISINKIETIKNIINYSLLTFLNQYNIKGIFKEPNDILVNNKKILGILIETKTLNIKYYEYVIIGIGINVNQTNFNNFNATSFKLLNKTNYDINTLFNELIKTINDNLIKYYKKKDFNI